MTLIEVRQAYTAPKKEKEPKAPAAAPAAPKAEKKKAEKEKDADEEDDDAKPEPKPKHACDLLPAPTSFPLDEWKRQYSNNDTPVSCLFCPSFSGVGERGGGIVEDDRKRNGGLTFLLV